MSVAAEARPAMGPGLGAFVQWLTAGLLPVETTRPYQRAATIGRRSRRLGTDPVVDLAVPPEDPGVSHAHASLLPGDDGTWALVDHGSTNGTYLNESRESLPANVAQTVRPGDRIYLGAWTRITLELGQFS